MRKIYTYPDILFAALLSAVILAIAFWNTYARARLNPGETAEPRAAGAYYRTPGRNGQWFGPEVNSLTLCSGAHTPYNNRGFFDITETIERAEVSPSRIPRALHWYRAQKWYFATDRTPWGTNYAYLTLRDDLGWSEINAGSGTTGFPWSGAERHWRDGRIIRAQASVTGWRRYLYRQERWICPMYYKVGGWEDESIEVHCSTLKQWFPPDWDVLKQKNGDFGPPMERKPGVLSRWGKKTKRWYDCIKIE